jgi:hypothetical protein
MDFDTLQEALPYVVGKSLHTVEWNGYPDITLKFPGKHQADTSPPGGDFVVCVTNKSYGWDQHQFTHGDIFQEFQHRFDQYDADAQAFFIQYARVVREGIDPGKTNYESVWDYTLLCALQCLAVAEHRRYARFENKGGGRFLPARFASGIVLGNWTAAKAAEVQKMGRPGVEMLEKQNGVMTLDAWVTL